MALWAAACSGCSGVSALVVEEETEVAMLMTDAVAAQWPAVRGGFCERSW